MKDITRIHIAKIAYDIEVSAKKDLSQYIEALNRYAEDSELIDDIEIRFTELLAERQVPAGGVITSQDVKSVRQQLGEPSDFAPESADEMVDGTEAEVKPRKLYRDQSQALVGGVLAGLAQFFQIEAIWVRLVFIILLVGSFGTASIIYLILWLIIPPARTATERLQMRGQPVTLESIKRLGDEISQNNDFARLARKTLRYMVGVGLLLVAIGALIATAVVGAVLLLGIGIGDSSPFSETILNSSWEATVAYGLFIVSGLLLAALGLLLTHAVLAKHFVKRTAIAVVAIIVVGIVTFSAGIGILLAASTYNYQQAQEAVVTTKGELPADFSKVKSLTVSAHAVDTRYDQSNTKIDYVVDPLSPGYQVTALPGLSPEIMIDGTEARIALKPKASDRRVYQWAQPKLVIRGPALDKVQVDQGHFQYTGGYPDEQPELSLSTLQMTEVSLFGKYKDLTIAGAGRVDVSQSSVVNLAINLDNGSIEAGVVRTLDVTQPDVCSAIGAYSNDNQIKVRGVSSGKLTYNGDQRQAETIRHDCGAIIIAGDEDSQDWED